MKFSIEFPFQLVSNNTQQIFVEYEKVFMKNILKTNITKSLITPLFFKGGNEGQEKGDSFGVLRHYDFYW